MKYLPLMIIAAVLLLFVIPFFGGGNRNNLPQQRAVETTQQHSQQLSQSDEVIEGSRGTFYVKDLEQEAYEKGFQDGFKGYQSWAAMNNFDSWWAFNIGTPANKKQKEYYKKYHDRLYESYSKGLHDGWE